MTAIDPFAEDYLRLALEISKHDEDYKEIYIGPPELEADVDAGDRKDLQTLLDDLVRLRDQLPDWDAQRLSNISARLDAMECTLRKLRGEEFDYFDEAKRLFNIVPEVIDEAEFERAHAELEAVLEGAGSLAERSANFKKHFEIPHDNLQEVVELVHNEVRKRTLALFDLPENEKVDLSLVEEKPYYAGAWYLGNGRTSIEVNESLPHTALSVPSLIAHEAYPGHHTEAVIKDSSLVQAEGRHELMFRTVFSPEIVTAEGIATTAHEMIFPDGELFTWIEEVLLPIAGIAKVPAEQMRRYFDVKFSIGFKVSANMGLKLNSGQFASEDDAVDYVMTYNIDTTTKAAQNYVRGARAYRTMLHTYVDGYRMIEEAAQKNGGDKKPIFLRLLKEDILPSQLAKF